MYGDLNTNHFSFRPNVLSYQKKKRQLEQMTHNKKINLTKQEQWDVSFGYELLLVRL
jgi:hypothetical protein